jgi:hypothetical protein
MLSKDYLDTARTILRAAQTMTDEHVATQLKALAENYERRAENTGMLMRPKHWLARLLTLKASAAHDLVGNFTATLRKKCLVTSGCPARGPVRSLLFLRYRLRAPNLELRD